MGHPFRSASSKGAADRLARVKSGGSSVKTSAPERANAGGVKTSASEAAPLLKSVGCESGPSAKRRLDRVIARKDGGRVETPAESTERYKREKAAYDALTPQQKMGASIRGPDFEIGRKKGGRINKPFEGSAKDEKQDNVLAKKHGMTMKAWEKSSLDKKHDEQESEAGLKCGGKVIKRATGGRVNKAKEAKTNVNIIIAQKPDAGAQAPLGPIGAMQAASAVPPMGGSSPIGAPPPAPLSASMPPGPPGAGAMPLPLRKSGGRVIPKIKDGAGSGPGRLEKTALAKRAG